MEKPFIKFFDRIILLLLGMTGIVYSCAKYGEPIAEYEVNGVVTDKTNTKPIQGIRVVRPTY